MPEPTNPPTLTEIEERIKDDEHYYLGIWPDPRVRDMCADRAHLLAEVRRLEGERNHWQDEHRARASEVLQLKHLCEERRDQLEAAGRERATIAGVLYQIVATYSADDPKDELRAVPVLDVLSAIANEEQVSIERVESLLPFPPFPASAPTPPESNAHPPPAWTRERPTEVGWYWRFDGYRSLLHCVENRDSDTWCYLESEDSCGEVWEPIEPRDGVSWSGPIEPPPLPGAEGGA